MVAVQVVSVLAFLSNLRSSNPAEVNRFLLWKCLKRMKLNEWGPFKKLITGPITVNNSRKKVLQYWCLILRYLDPHTGSASWSFKNDFRDFSTIVDLTSGGWNVASNISAENGFPYLRLEASNYQFVQVNVPLIWTVYAIVSVIITEEWAAFCFFYEYPTQPM